MITSTGLWSLMIALLMTAFFIISKSWLLLFFTSITAVTQQLYLYFGWIYALPLLSVWAFWLDGIFIGAGATRVMLYSLLFSCLLVFLPVWWLTQDLGNHGLCLSFSLFNLARGISLGLCMPAAIIKKGQPTLTPL